MGTAVRHAQTGSWNRPRRNIRRNSGVRGSEVARPRPAKTLHPATPAEHEYRRSKQRGPLTAGSAVHGDTSCKHPIGHDASCAQIASPHPCLRLTETVAQRGANPHNRGVNSECATDESGALAAESSILAVSVTYTCPKGLPRPGNGLALLDRNLARSPLLRTIAGCADPLVFAGQPSTVERRALSGGETCGEKQS